METVYSMIIDRMQADADLRLFAVISTMARQGVIAVEVAERVWKERNDTLGNITLMKYLSNNEMHSVTPRQWTLDWLKLMHEEGIKRIKRIQSKEKEMKTVSFKEAMYALADGKALYRIDGTKPNGFNESVTYAIGEHPHAKVIRDFAEGKKIEVNNGEGDTWTATSWPSFAVGHKYRVKPEFPFREGNTIVKHDGSMWTITTGARLHEMTGLGPADEKLVVFRQDKQNPNGISWDMLENCLRNCGIERVLVAAKNRE